MKYESKIHLPSPSFWPIVLAFGLALIAVGVVSFVILSVVGVIVLLVSIAGWTLENRAGSLKEDDHE